MAPGKIALPTSPKLESQPVLGETEVTRSVVAKRLLKGAALGTAAWFIVTTALKGGPSWVSTTKGDPHKIVDRMYLGARRVRRLGLGRPRQTRIASRRLQRLGRF